MQANNVQVKLNDDRRKEYQRQQERLKAMAASSEKNPTVSADVMIENLLKSSFKKIPEMSTAVEQLDYSYGELPFWLQHNSTAVPTQYRYLWSLVQSTVDLANTQKVSQLLLTSGLQVDVLGFIWSLANKTVPGQLTKQEFYIVLALVSLVQNGYTFSNLDVLKLLTVPSMPVLQLGLQKFPVPQSDISEKTQPPNFNTLKEIPSLLSSQSNPVMGLSESEKERNNLINNSVIESTFLSDFKENTDSPKENNGKNSMSAIKCNNHSKPNLVDYTIDIHKNSNFPYIGSSPTAELEDDFSAFQSVPAETTNACNQVNQSKYDSRDDFSEFQSAGVVHEDPFETFVVNQKREIPKIPIPKTVTEKFTGTKSNILKISQESGKKLKVLSTPESLSSLPESKISSTNKVSTSVSVLGSNHGIGSRLANHSFSAKSDKPKCHKHHKIKINPSSPVNPNTESDIILGVKTRNLEAVIPKCRPRNSNTYTSFILKETKIKCDDAAESANNELLDTELETSGTNSGEQTRQIEIPMLGTFNETVLPTQSKPHSATVDLITVQEDKYSALREIELELNKEKNFDLQETGDDFGDFLSADVSALSIPKPSESLVEAPDSNSDLPFFKNEFEGSWGDWNFNIETTPNSSDTTGALAPLTSNAVTTDNAPAFKPENDLFNSFKSLTLNEDNKKEFQPDIFSSNQLDCFGGDAKLDFGCDEIKFQQKTEKFFTSQGDQTDAYQLDKEFEDFLSAEAKPPCENIFGKFDSPPNLDLNIPTSDASEQEIVWRKCIDSCHSLIQEGFDIFNNINTKSVLDEVFAAPETETYLNNLNIVCQISKRVSQNFSTFSSSQNEIEKLWERLQDLCFEYNIKLKSDEDNLRQGKFRCSICLGHIGQNIINQGSHSYHPSCANLWINHIEKILPSLV